MGTIIGILTGLEVNFYLRYYLCLMSLVFQKVGIFVQAIILVIMGIYGPKSLRNVSWAMFFLR